MMRVTVAQAAMLPSRTARAAATLRKNQVLHRMHGQNSPARGAEHLEDHGLLDAAPLRRRERAGEHQGPRDQCDAAGGADRLMMRLKTALKELIASLTRMAVTAG